MHPPSNACLMVHGQLIISPIIKCPNVGSFDREYWTFDEATADRSGGDFCIRRAFFEPPRAELSKNGLRIDRGPRGVCQIFLFFVDSKMNRGS